MNLDLAASLRTSFRVLWLLPKRLRQSDQKKKLTRWVPMQGADWIGQSRSKAPCHGIDTQDASACRFLIEGDDDLGLEPPPGAGIYLFSGAPVGGALRVRDHLPVFQPRFGRSRRPSALLEGLQLNELLDKHWAGFYSTPYH